MLVDRAEPTTCALVKPAALRAALYRVPATTPGELLRTSRTLLHRSRLYPGQAPGLN